MKITRVINGVSYDLKLRPNELHEAYVEQEHIYDLEDVRVHIGNTLNPEDKYGKSKDELLSMADDMAWEKRRNVDKYDMDSYEATEAAIGTIANK